MTLANMRHNGVRSLAVRCELCHREAVINVDGYDEGVAVPSFGPRMVRTVCCPQRPPIADMEQTATAASMPSLPR